MEQNLDSSNNKYNASYESHSGVKYHPQRERGGLIPVTANIIKIPILIHLYLNMNFFINVLIVLIAHILKNMGRNVDVIKLLIRKLHLNINSLMISLVENLQTIILIDSTLASKLMHFSKVLMEYYIDLVVVGKE